MGICVSSHTTRQHGVFLNLASSAQVIHWNGSLQELWRPTKTEDILSRNPYFFLCCSETMNLCSVPRQMAKDETLQLGQLYFLIPVSMINQPFSLQDLCTLAVKASKALSCSNSVKGRLALQASVGIVNVGLPFYTSHKSHVNCL